VRSRSKGPRYPAMVERRRAPTRAAPIPISGTAVRIRAANRRQSGHGRRLSGLVLRHRTERICDQDGALRRPKEKGLPEGSPFSLLPNLRYG
jgi:hypothetical protein